jgi:hypothetical protein
MVQRPLPSVDGTVFTEQKADPIFAIRKYEAGHDSRAVGGMYCLRSLASRDRGFEIHTRHGCLVRVFILFVCPRLRSRKPKSTAVGIHCVDHATTSIH